MGNLNQIRRELTVGLTKAPQHDFWLELVLSHFDICQCILVWLHVNSRTHEKLVNFVLDCQVSQPLQPELLLLPLLKHYLLLAR